MSEYKTGVIVAVIRAVYGLPAKCVGYMGLVWEERSNNTHTLPITRQLWVVSHQSGSFISVLSVPLLSKYCIFIIKIKFPSPNILYHMIITFKIEKSAVLLVHASLVAIYVRFY